VAQLKPAYLIHGDDHGAIAERRAGLRALAERAGGDAGSVELLEGAAATPAGAAGALAAMTLTTGRRVVLVEGVERWREGEVKEHLVPAMGAIAPDTTLALFAREEPRAKAPAAVHEAVRGAGGQVVAQLTVKPWELAGWTREQAARMGISLDGPAAKALVDVVGERQQRLLRELEKLALEGEVGPNGARAVDVEEIERRAAHSASSQAFSLADALVAGDTRAATRLYVRLRGQGERLSGLIYLMAARLRDGALVAERLRAGESVAEVRRGLRMPPRAAQRFVADAGRGEPERLREALAAVADLELDSRGGAPVTAGRSPLAALAEDTIAVRTIAGITRPEPV
jgi:DNA polymerase III subunit delta